MIKPAIQGFLGLMALLPLGFKYRLAVDCAVFIASIYRSSPPGELGLVIQPLDHDQLAGDKTTSARHMNDKIEQLVRRFPEQYQWSYRRFTNKAYGPAK